MAMNQPAGHPPNPPNTPTQAQHPHQQTGPLRRRAHAVGRGGAAEVPMGFVESVMAAIRAQPHRSATLALAASPPSRLSITEHAAITLLSAAADSVAGATARSCRFPTPGDPTHLQVSISLIYWQPAHAIADQIRAVLQAAARTQLGLHFTRIDITIDDIHRPPTPPPAPSRTGGARHAFTT